MNAATDPFAFQKETLARFRTMSEGLWERYPELNSFMGAFVEVVRARPMRDSLTACGDLLLFLLRSYRPSSLSYQCDVILFYSAKKPNIWPAMGDLAEAVAKKGYRCALFSNKRLELFSWNADENKIHTDFVNDYKVRLIRARSPFHAIASLLRGARVATHLLAKAWRHDRSLLTVLARNGLIMLRDLVIGSHRHATLDTMMTTLNPKIVLSASEHIRIGGDLIVSARRQGHRTVYFSNLDMNADLLDPLLSDEIWVANDRVGQDIRSLIDSSSALRKVEIVGSPEVEYSLQQIESRTPDEERLADFVSGMPTVVFVSEYVAWGGLSESDSFTQAMTWLNTAIEQMPQWRFIYKPRPGKSDERPPLIDQIGQHDNVLIASGSVSLRSLLALDSVRAVMAIGSSALYVAAGVGKEALRLELNTSLIANNVAGNEVSTAINSAEELIVALKGMEEDGHSSVVAQTEAFFPFRGKTIERMADLLSERLSELGRMAPGLQAR